MPKKKHHKSKHHNVKSKSKVHNKNEINIKIGHGGRSKSEPPQYIPFGGGGSTIVNNIPQPLPFDYQNVNQNNAYLIMLQNLQNEINNLKTSHNESFHANIEDSATKINSKINNTLQPISPLVIKSKPPQILPSISSDSILGTINNTPLTQSSLSSPFKPLDENDSFLEFDNPLYNKRTSSSPSLLSVEESPSMSSLNTSWDSKISHELEGMKTPLTLLRQKPQIVLTNTKPTSISINASKLDLLNDKIKQINSEGNKHIKTEMTKKLAKEMEIPLEKQPQGPSDYYDKKLDEISNSIKEQNKDVYGQLGKFTTIR